MSEPGNVNVDELLSGYLDDQLSERQSNEARRLIQRDPRVAAQLRAMENQRKLLGGLPVEEAPPHLLDDIKATLERRLILDHYPETTGVVRGARQLFWRRVLTAAAMFLLPAGLLGLVLYQIIAPPSNNVLKEVAGADDPAVQVNPSHVDLQPVSPAPVVASAPVRADFFHARLDLTTRELITINEYLNKVIFSNGLLDDMVFERRDASCTYKIESSPERLAALLADMPPIWGKCRDHSLTLYGPSVDSTVQIGDVTPSQVASLLRQTSVFNYIETGRGFARQNRLNTALAYQTVTPPLETDAGMGYAPSMPIWKPILTQPQAAPGAETTPSAGRAKLVIRVDSDVNN